MLQGELNALFDVIEIDADVKIYLNRPDFKTEEAGIVITSNPMFQRFPIHNYRGEHSSDKYTLYFGRGITSWRFRTLTEAFQKVINILKTANVPISPSIEFHTKNIETKLRKNFKEYFENYDKLAVPLSPKGEGIPA